MYISFSVVDEPKTYCENIINMMDGINSVHILLAIALFIIAIMSFCMYKKYRHDTTIASEKDELYALAVLQNEKYEKLVADVAEMKRRQKTDTIVAELLVVHSAAAEREYRNGMKEKHSCAHFNALKTDFDNLQKSNEKLIREHDEMKHRFGILEKSNEKLIRKHDKFKLLLGIVERSNEQLVREQDELKLRLGIVERDVTINSSVIIGGGGFSSFDGPAARRIDRRAPHVSYADGNYGRPTEFNAFHRHTVPFVGTNNVYESVPSSTSCPPPQCLPAVPPATEVTDPAQNVSIRIPITREILQSVVLKKPGDVPPKIKVPAGMIPSSKETPEG